MVIYVTTMPIGYCNNYATHKIVVLKQTRSDIQSRPRAIGTPRLFTYSVVNTRGVQSETS